MAEIPRESSLNEYRDERDKAIEFERMTRVKQIEAKIRTFMAEGHSLAAAYAKFVDPDANMRGYGGARNAVKPGKLTSGEWKAVKGSLK